MGWLRRGVVEFDVGVVDPETDAARVKLAIEGMREDGWHAGGFVDVV